MHEPGEYGFLYDGLLMRVDSRGFPTVTCLQSSKADGTEETTTAER